MVHVDSCKKLISAPLCVLSDFSGTTDPINATNTATSTLNPTPNNPKPPKTAPQGKATQTLLFALAGAIFAIFPVATLAPWQASFVHAQCIDEQRVWSDADKRWYYYNRHTKLSRWCLADELCSQEGLRKVRTLTFTADEGSTGWALFQYLASECRARILFIRDPPHRISTTGPEYFRNLRGRHTAPRKLLTGPTIPEGAKSIGRRRRRRRGVGTNLAIFSD